MPHIEEIGIPVKETNWLRLHPWTDEKGEKSLLGTYGQNNGGLFVIDIDLETGHCQQLYTGLEGADYPTAAYRSQKTGILYVGSAYPGHLHAYDRTNDKGLEDLGPIDPDLAKFPTGITEGPDGSIYIGAWTGASLTRFDPSTREFTRFGKMDDIDLYLYPLCGDDGTLAAIVSVCHNHIITINPQTGAYQSIDSSIIDSETLKKENPFFKGKDGLLYITTPQQDYRIEGMAVLPIEKAAPPCPFPARGSTFEVTFADGTVATMDDFETRTNRQIKLSHPDRPDQDKLLTLNWEGGGTDLFSLHLGPDNAIYGSSLLPEHLFRVNPDGSNLEDLGQCSVSFGEAYSMANHKGKLFIGSYPQGRLSLYDPDKPYAFGTTPDDNPCDYGSPDPIAYRPYALLGDPLDKIWMGAVPDYGLTGGILGSFDPISKIFKAYKDLVNGCSPVSLCWLSDLQQILIGWSIEPGTGAKPVAKQGTFNLWDPQKEEITWQGDFGISEIADVNSLLTTNEGLVYAIISRKVFDNEQPETYRAPRLILIDPIQKNIIDEITLDNSFGQDTYNCLKQDPDGNYYGATKKCFFHIQTGSTQVEPIWQTEQDEIAVPGPVLKDRFIFATAYKLRALIFG